MRISEAFNSYKLDVIVFKNQSIKTEENHFICMRSLIAFFGDVEISTLTFQNVRDWKIHLDKDKCPETVRNYIIKLRVVLQYLRMAHTPCLDPETVPVPKRSDKVPGFITERQVATLINNTCKIKNKAIVSLLYSYGLRVGELCRMNRGDIKEDYSFTVVGKGGVARLCFTDDRTMLLITEYLKSRRDNNPALFLTENGKRITPGTIQETFKSIRCKTGIEAHPHTLRHSFATNLLKSNTNIRHVQVMLGHKSLLTTQMYTHVVNEDLREIYLKHHTL